MRLTGYGPKLLRRTRTHPQPPFSPSRRNLAKGGIQPTTRDSVGCRMPANASV